MNKHYLILVLLISTCLLHADNTQDCKTSMDAFDENICSCSETGKIGICTMRTLKSNSKEYYCDCTIQPKIRSKSNLSDSNDIYQVSDVQLPTSNKTPTINNSDIHIFSQDIHAPIYNLPMQRTLIPLSHGTIDCPWLFSVAPYAKTTQKEAIGNAKFENTEIGSLVHLGYYSSWWFVNVIAALGGSKTEANITNGTYLERWHSGSDALFALGLKTDNDRYSTFAANGEFFFGISSNRLDADNSYKIFAPGNPSTGIQGNIDWTFATFNYCKFELSAFSRFTHFFKKTIESGNQQISYTPGSFVDVLLGFTQYYGSDYQHQFEIGYNPTVRVIKASSFITQDAPAANLNEPAAGKLYHTAYATYSYHWETNGLPMAFSLGGSATVTPHTNTYGTAFGTFGLSF